MLLWNKTLIYQVKSSYFLAAFSFLQTQLLQIVYIRLVEYHHHIEKTNV